MCPLARDRRAKLGDYAPTKGLFAGAWQIPFFERGFAGALPADNSVVLYGSQGNYLAFNILMGVVAVLDFDDVVPDQHSVDILAGDVSLIGYSGLDVVYRPVAGLHVVIEERSPGTGREADAFGDLCADRVILVSRDRDRAQDADNPRDNH